MTLRVSGKNLDIGEALRQHVLEKVEAMVARYFDGRVSGHVVMPREGSGYRSDCTLHLSSGVDLQAEGRAHEPYPCFDQAADKIERRLRRYKRRLKGHAGVPRRGRGQGRQLCRRAAGGGRRSRRGFRSRHRGGRNRRAQKPVGRLRRRRTRPDGRAGGGFPARWQRAGECRLSAPRRRDRLARSAVGASTRSARRCTMRDEHVVIESSRPTRSSPRCGSTARSRRCRK